MQHQLSHALGIVCLSYLTTKISKQNNCVHPNQGDKAALRKSDWDAFHPGLLWVMSPLEKTEGHAPQVPVIVTRTQKSQACLCRSPRALTFLHLETPEKGPVEHAGVGAGQGQAG